MVKILGKEVTTLRFGATLLWWQEVFNKLLAQDERAAMNFLVRADTRNGGVRHLKECFGEGDGALVFNAFVSAGHESAIGMKAGTCAYPRCRVVGSEKMIYVNGGQGAKQTTILFDNL